MSVQSQTPFNSYTANGATTVFPYSFLLLESGDLVVSVDGVVKTLATDYTISGLTNPEGGNVTFVSPPANGAKVLLLRMLTIQRLSDYQENGDLYAATINNDLDRLWLALQQLQQNDIRALKLPVDTTTDQVIAQDAASRVGKLVSFDASGNMILSVPADLALQTVSAFIATLLDDANAATARATLGAGDANKADIQGQTATAVTSAGSAPAFTVDTNPAYGALAAGQRMRVKFHAAGTTGINTLNRDGHGAKNIKQYDSTGAKVAAIVAANQLADVEYDGTDMVILDPLPPAAQTFTVGKGVALTNTGAISVPNTTWTTLTWDTEGYDDNSFHSTVSNTERVTIPAGAAGRYLVTAVISFASSNNGAHAASLRKNGTQIFATGLGLYTDVPLGLESIAFSQIVDLAVGDYLDVQAYQASGAAVNTSQNNSRLQVTRIN